MDSQYNVDSTQQTTTSSSQDVGLDKIYMKSIDSILKIAEMVLSLIVFICVTSHPGYSYIGGGWVQFVSISCLITVLILWIFFMLRIIYKLPGPWQLIILIYHIVYTIFYIISFLVCAIQGGKYQESDGLIAGAIMIYYIVYVVFYLISFLVCAIQAGNWYPNGGLIAGAFVVYGVLYLISVIVCLVQSSKVSYSGGFIAGGVFCFIILLVLGADTFFQFRKWQESGSGLGTRTTTSATTTTTTHTTYETRTQY